MNTSVSDLAPNLTAVLGATAAEQLLALPGVSLRNLSAISPAAMTHIGKPAAASGAAAAPAAEAAAATDANADRGFLYRLALISSLPSQAVKTKGANILASAIKAAAAADVARSSADGAVGRDQLEKARKRLEELIPMVDFVAEEDVELAVPRGDGAGGGVAGNARHRAGQKSKKQRRIDELDRKLQAKLLRCTTDEAREAAMRSREYQSMYEERQRLIRNSGNNSGGGAAAAAGEAGAGARRQREDDDDDDDEYSKL